jgi:hypothetical protein
MTTPYIGSKDERGVRTFPIQMTQMVRIFVGILLTTMGLSGVGFSIRTLIWWQLKYHIWFWDSVTILPLSGCEAVAGIYMLRLQILMARTSSVNKVCSRLGIQEELLKAIAEERDIKPQYNLNGRDYYNMADFKDVGSLLRASQQPTVATETLLRPAANTETSPETLLRADNAAQQVQSAGSEEKTTELKVGVNKPV